jgi:hypothetical protein
MNKCLVCSGRFTQLHPWFTRIEPPLVRVYIVRVNLVNRTPPIFLYAPICPLCRILKGNVVSPGSPLSVDAHQSTFYVGEPRVNLDEPKELTL